MKVRDLINQLKDFDADEEVKVYVDGSDELLEVTAIDLDESENTAGVLIFC